MSVTYTDSVGAPLPNGAVNYNTVFSAIMTASNNIGYTMQNTFVSTLTTDSKTNVVQGVKYGDTTSPNAPGTLFTVNKSTGLITATEPLGEWGRSVIGGTDTFSELLAKQVINNQYHSNPCINGTIMTSKLDKFMYVDPSFSGIRQLNPIARIVDRDLNPYVFMRGAWSTAMDEWTGSWWGVINSTTSTVTNGSTGGPDDPIGNDDGPSWEGLQKPPSSNVQALSSAGKIGRFDGTLQQDDFPDKFFITTTDQITSAGTITSIPTNTIRDYNGESYAMLKKGMSLLIIDTEYEGRNGVLHLHEVVVSADQVAGATEIYIESYVLGSDIAAGMKVEINFEALMDQQEITLTTTGTSGAATLVGDVLNVPVYSGGGTIQNFSWCDCTGTTSTSATDGEANAVVVRYDTEKITSAVDNITLYGVGGVAGVSGSAFCFSMGPDAKYEVSWNVCT